MLRHVVPHACKNYKNHHYCPRVRLADARKVVALMNELEDNDDVNNVYANFDMTAELAAALAAEE